MADFDHDEAQAARILGVSTDTLRRWRRMGAIGFHRMPGGRIRYSVDQLAAFRTSCRVNPTKQPG
ncbi:helix-turn-helix domain-containing protein [Sphingomonas sp. MG17]|uniref:Helix-turn-helix domain-containing protein n=1 Tax=Sphingomonas tagetis TaxID=2949092 RepID=A0A9X2KLY5_9SPHN|nr:helix-turn-helix domain-containing protein [Sphingomonas tagetis]MCP3732024.1 helix-turn-helix domain-containing protein [Sphingomonas tagetis]